MRGAVTGCGLGVPWAVYPRFSVEAASAEVLAVVAVWVAGCAVVVLVAGVLPVAVVVVVVAGLAVALLVAEGVAVVPVAGRVTVVVVWGLFVPVLPEAGRAVVVVVVLEEEELEAGRVTVVGRLVEVVAGRAVLCCAFW